MGGVSMSELRAGLRQTLQRKEDNVRSSQPLLSGSMGGMQLRSCSDSACSLASSRSRISTTVASCPRVGAATADVSLQAAEDPCMKHCSRHVLGLYVLFPALCANIVSARLQAV